jgi:hypothetical protein
MPRDSPPSTVRRDGTGSARAALAELIATGHDLHRWAQLLADASDLAAFSPRYEQWVRSCLSELAAAFEPESVREFARIGRPLPRTSRLGAPTKAALAATSNGLEFLTGLLATLKTAAPASTPADLERT